jgi:FkbM family methyltransferase
MPHPLLTFAAVTRALQARFPSRTLPAIHRLKRLLIPLGDVGIVTLPDGAQMRLDMSIGAHRQLLLYGAYQPPLAHALRTRLRAGAYCLDIGANVGFFALAFAAHVGKGGRVAAFEANPALVEGVRAQAELNDFTQLTVYHNAVTEQGGATLPFYISSNLGKSSLYADHVDVAQQVVEVASLSIDEFIEREGWARLDVVKIDIEGADVYALLGGAQTIARFRPLIAFEFDRDTPAAIIERLRALFDTSGYRLEMLYIGGGRAPFDWRVPASLEHIDVLCVPTL